MISFILRFFVHWVKSYARITDLRLLWITMLVLSLGQAATAQNADIYPDVEFEEIYQVFYFELFGGTSYDLYVDPASWRYQAGDDYRQDGFDVEFRFEDGLVHKPLTTRNVNPAFSPGTIVDDNSHNGLVDDPIASDYTKLVAVIDIGGPWMPMESVRDTYNSAAHGLIECTTKKMKDFRPYMAMGTQKTGDDPDVTDHMRASFTYAAFTKDPIQLEDPGATKTEIVVDIELQDGTIVEAKRGEIENQCQGIKSLRFDLSVDDAVMAQYRLQVRLETTNVAGVVKSHNIKEYQLYSWGY